MSKLARPLAFLSLLVLGILSLCCSVAPSSRSASSGYSRGNIDTLRSSTVALVQLKIASDATAGDDAEDDDGQPHVYCSGVWLSDSRILTAAHCVKDVTIGGLVDVASYSESDWGAGHEAKIKETHSAHLIKRGTPAVDLALLSAYSPNPHSWEPVASSVDDGEPLLIVGHPIGLLWNVVPGFVSAHRRIDEDGIFVSYLHVTSAAFYGNSGGAAFNDRGEIAGISSFLVRGAPLMSFFVPADEIRQFLNGK